MSAQQLINARPERPRKTSSIVGRLMREDWQAIEQELWHRGYAKTSAVLTGEECDQLVNLYMDNTKFRSRVEMARYRFGLGEYKYFADPLPGLVEKIRVETYRHLVSAANRWMTVLGSSPDYPSSLDRFLEICATHGQSKPAPLLLRYHQNDYNCLHQDILGEVAFPFQLTCALSRRNIDYTGGEFVLVERRRGQLSPEVITLEQGEIVIFATHSRPVPKKRKKCEYTNARLQHGVSRITSGSRFTLGVIFHNSK